MKKLVSLLFVLFAVASVYAAEPDSLLLAGDSFRNPTFNKDDCTCEGKKLYGKVKVVNSGADFDVRVVDSFADLDVKVVSSFADECGEWEFVDSFPDFTIRFVDSFSDFDIRFVGSFPGVR